MSDGKQFSLDLSAWVKKAKGNMDQVVRKVVLDVGTRIVMRSPVGDGAYWASPPPPGYIGGRFRANWQYGEATAPKGDLPDIDRTGGKSIARIALGVKPNAAGKIHYLTNNLPYAMRLEMGWSKNQAPSGMVGVTVVEFQSIVRDAAVAVNR